MKCCHSCGPNDSVCRLQRPPPDSVLANDCAAAYRCWCRLAWSVDWLAQLFHCRWLFVSVCVVLIQFDVRYQCLPLSPYHCRVYDLDRVTDAGHLLSSGLSVVRADWCSVCCGPVCDDATQYQRMDHSCCFAVEWQQRQAETLGETEAPLHCDSRTFTLISKLEEILQSRTTYST